MAEPFSWVSWSVTLPALFRALAGLALVMAATGPLAVPVHAQEPAASPAFLPPGHWAVGAVERLAAAGALRVPFDAGRRTLTQAEVARLLAVAARDTGAEGRLAQAYLERFEEAFPEAGLGGFGGSALSGGYARHAGGLRTGYGYWNGYLGGGHDWQDPTPLAADAGAALDGAVQWTPVTFFAVRASVSSVGGRTRVDEGYLAGRVGPVVGWVGRRVEGFGPGAGGGVVLSATTAFDGAGLTLIDAVRLPWILRWLGPVYLEALAARLPTRQPFAHPGFFAMRGSIAPHPRLRLGVNRAAIFGGRGNLPVTVGNLAYMLVGGDAIKNGANFANQVVSVDVQYRAPTEAWMPLRFYVEWGFEDAAGAWWNVPGVVAGVEAPALPGMPSASAGVEHTSFAHSCCSNPIWYRHSWFQEGWTVDGTPLGHPLAGNGTEWLAWGRLDLDNARLRLAAEARVRDRGVENLLAPTRQGTSTGGRVQVTYEHNAAWRLTLDAAGERGSGWRESNLTLALQWRP